jgi:heat shock protein HslJ
MTHASRRGRTTLTVVAISVVVAAIAIGVVLARASANHAAPHTGHGPLLGAAIGIDWRLTTVQDANGIYRNSRSQPRIALDVDGTVQADDGINFMSGRYEMTAGGFVFRDVASTLSGYAGDDPDVLVTQAGMAAVLTRPSADVDRQTLVLSARGYTLTFRAAGEAPPHVTAPASPTGTTTAQRAPASYVHNSELPATGAS